MLYPCANASGDAVGAGADWGVKMMVKRHQARYRSFRYAKLATGRKGVPGRKIIASAYVAPNNEYVIHATKGFRWRRLPKARNELLEWMLGRVR